MEYVRIAILSPYDVFLGAMDNETEDSLHYYDDELIEYLKGTASTFSCKVNAQHEDSRHLVEGNKLSFRHQNNDYYLNIMHVERDEYEVYIEAYTLSFELLNEKRSAYKASTAMSFEEYLEVFDPEHVVSLGLNEVSDKKIIHEWTGEETILGRLFSLATVFSAELEFLPRLNDNYSLKQIVMNAYKEHSDTVQGVGRDRTDLVLRYNKQISGIKKTSDITELYTAITPTGRDGLTLASLDKTEYDSEGNVEYRKPAGSTHLYAVQARDRFPSNLMAAENERYIGVDWEYDTDNVNTLYGQALAQLKKNCVPQVSYEVEGYFDTGIGDTVIIADEDFNPELYLQARVTEQHRSFTDPTQNKTTFDNFKELQSQIDASLLSRVEELIAQGKTYTAMISTNNGIVFRNGIGETTMTAHVRDASGVELADNYEIHWFKDGSEVYIGNPYTISADDVDGKAVYRFEAVDTSGTVKAFYEVTVSDVSDGGKGDPGEDGRSVVSVTEEYYLSTSKTELIGGEWTEIPPTWTKGTYLWKRTKYVYENPPGTEYTTPICDSSWEAANDVSDDLHNNYYDKEETDTKIQDASDKADQAITDAESAKDAADEAKESAQEAINKADSASQNAAEAKEEAAKSQQAASNAQSEIAKINGEITTVKDDIDTTLEGLADQAAETESIKKTMEVEYAKKTDVSNIEATLKTEIDAKVGELQSTVEETYAAKTEIIDLEGKLQTQITQNADNLSSTATKVEKLESDTEEAQKQVDQAIAKADAAQSAADAAQADATAAQTTATSAQQKADAAQALADTADKAVQAAQSDLDEAKQNLTNVTNRVGATEADIAAAQAKVDAAQEAVDNALENAAEANLAATNAQQAADQAKLDAQEAQTAADKAQEDASQALKDVAALTKRVTTAETNISQNAEQIALAAQKAEEIGDLLKNGYYNKTETESLLEVEAGKITSSVKETVMEEVGKIKIGGTNLLPRSTETVGSNMSYDGTVSVDEGYSVSDYIEIDPDSNYVFTKTESETVNPDAWVYVIYDSGKTRITGTSNSDNEAVIDPPSSANYIRFAYPTDCKVKMEKGTIATDWSPAPEDVQEDIDNAQNSADNAQSTADSTESRVTVAESTIQQLSDSIAMLVVDENGESMMTQTSDGWRFDMGSINSQLSNAANKLNDLAGDMAQADQTIQGLNDLANDIAEKTAYIVMTTDDSGAPCIELGKSDNPFKVRITNTSIDFMQGSSRIAYIDNQSLYIERAVIKNELQIGDGSGFIWKKRNNGHLGLRWVGGGS